MKIAVIGAGAIGGLVAGYLKSKGEDVALVGHPSSVSAIKEKGLRISGVRGTFQSRIDIYERLPAKADVIILATKTQDLQEAVKDNLPYLKDAAIITTQNGIQADAIVSRFIPKDNIISSIVMFAATTLEPGEIVHNFEGSWIIGRFFSPNDEQVIAVSQLMDKIFPAIVCDDIKGMKYLKIFVNANNCIPALLGTSMQEAFADPQVSRISVGIWKEGLDIISGARITLLSLPDFPVERLTKLTSLPLDQAAQVFSGIMKGLSKEPLYGSILQSIKRGKSSEIDYINGEFVALAKSNGLSAPLNARLTEMVHEVERTRRFFTKDELLRLTGDYIFESQDTKSQGHRSNVTSNG